MDKLESTVQSCMKNKLRAETGSILPIVSKDKTCDSSPSELNYCVEPRNLPVLAYKLPSPPPSLPAVFHSEQSQREMKLKLKLAGKLIQVYG